MYCIENQINYVIIGSENYINDGIVDYIESLSKDITCIAPPKNVAKIETSKKFARNLLRNNKLDEYNPDYMLVLPWHFKSEILKREKLAIKQGTKFIFPLPKIKIIKNI